MTDGKICPRCKEHKPWPGFPKNKSRSDRHAAHCKKCSAIIIASSRLKKPEKYRLINRARRHKIPILHFQALLDWWQGGCGYCGEDKPLEYDHDHKTGYFRTFACHGCNVVIARANDDPELLRKIADALEEMQSDTCKP